MMVDDAQDLARVHERLDDLFAVQSDVKAALAKIAEGCGPCKTLVQKHETALYGNGKAGVLTRIETAEQGRVDTLSVKSVVVIIGAVGTLAATIGGAMAALVK